MAKKNPTRAIDQERSQTLEVSEVMLHELRAAVRLREEELVKAQKYLADRALSTENVEGFLQLLRGDGPTRPGLKALLGFREEGDPNQLDIESEAGGDEEA